MLRCTILRRRLHTPFVFAALVVAVLLQCGLVVTGAVPPLTLHALLAAVRPAPSAPVPAPTLAADDAASAPRLAAAFARLGYHLAAVADGGAVPRVVVDSVPDDLGDVVEPDARKTVFLRLMLPLVLMADEQVAAERSRLQAIAEQQRQGLDPGPRQAAWLEGLAFRYEVEDGPRLVQRLLERVDVVPPSLALAQAALETGWGTSRLVRRDNNLFGQNIESDGAVVGQASFPSLLDAVRSYVHNLDTHHAYHAFRRARAEARRAGRDLDGLALAATLTAYSELGRDYVDDVESVIRGNGLDRLDDARLDSAAAGHAGPGEPQGI